MTMQNLLLLLINNTFFHPTFYSKSVLKARESLCDQCKLIELLNKLIHKGYLTNVLIKNLNTVYIGTNIDFVISKFKNK